MSRMSQGLNRKVDVHRTTTTQLECRQCHNVPSRQALITTQRTHANRMSPLSQCPKQPGSARKTMNKRNSNVANVTMSQVGRRNLQVNRHMSIECHNVPSRQALILRTRINKIIRSRMSQVPCPNPKSPIPPSLRLTGWNPNHNHHKCPPTRCATRCSKQAMRER